MRILQIIDSLDSGGAEKMAVNYANALSEKLEFSGLITTRKEGVLLNHLNNKVKYYYLKKNKSIDLNAIFTLRSYCKLYKITHIHAHGSSFFLATLLKICTRKILIIWHDHNGNRENDTFLIKKSLKLCSFFFNGIITVNKNLELQAKKNLFVKKIICLPNFTIFNEFENKQTILKGINDKRIVQIANLRNPKNHLITLKIAQRLKNIYPEWSFHFIGMDYNDKYSINLKRIIIEYNIENSVYIYGQKEDVFNILNQCNIALITSTSEGLPVAVLEYGISSLPLISSNVGDIPLIVESGKSGFLFNNNDLDCFYKSLLLLIENTNLRIQIGKELRKNIENKYSKNAVINKYLNWIIE